MKRMTTMGLVFVLVLVVAVPVVMARGGGYVGFGFADNAQVSDVELTEEQQAELAAIHDQMWELRYQLLNKQRELGLISEQDASIVEKRLALMQEYQEQYGTTGGYGPCHPGRVNQRVVRRGTWGSGHGPGMMGW